MPPLAATADALLVVGEARILSCAMRLAGLSGVFFVQLATLCVRRLDWLVWVGKGVHGVLTRCLFFATQLRNCGFQIEHIVP